MGLIDYRVSNSIAIIAMDNSPVNALGYALRKGIVSALDQAQADQAVRAVVLIGTDRAFSGGADIGEFNSASAFAEPSLHTVIELTESREKPVIAAIGGVCMGGGLELALGCHYRVSTAGALIALPEVKLGILPGAGGTQRLPRVVGVERSLEMIISGTAVPSEKLKDTALFDEFVDGDLLEGALAFAGKLVVDKRGPKRVRDIKIDYPNAEAFFQFARANVGAASKNYPAPMRCLEAVAASVSMPFAKGLAFEREQFTHLVETPESHALRHAFFAERAASKIPDIPAEMPTRKIEKVAVIGAGTMGGGIAMCFLNAGFSVTILETKQEALDRGVGLVRKNYESTVKKGRLTSEKLETQMSLLKPTLSYDDIRDADLVVEAVFEEINVKEQVFAKLDEVMKSGAILATNTSTLDVNRIAQVTNRPQDVVGMHFFSPAHVMRLLEVVRGEATAKDVLATVMSVAKKIKKTAVVSGVCDGFIGNRMLNEYLRQALFMLEEGALPQQVDRAIEKWGMAMGPFRMLDLAGNDVHWAVRKRQVAENPALKYPEIADQLCELGRYGQKTGSGWYLYQPGKRGALPDSEVDKMVITSREQSGIKARKISDDEIVGRLVYALANEGAKILEEGIALRASDIDTIYLAGYGFPIFRGGPMFYADQTGLYNVVRAMKAYAQNKDGSPEFWQPAPLLTKLVAEGRTFN